MKKWIVNTPVPREFMDSFPELPNIVKQLLHDRGIRTQKKMDEFLNPDFERDVHDPFLFKDMRKAVDRIFAAIKNKEFIVIHGDYDADGVSASVILTNTLNELGANTDIFLPHRETDGYGLNENTVTLLHEKNAKVIITCDCGISNGPEIQKANSLGIDTIITDHHEQPAVPPNAYAIIHPKVPGETYPDKTLAGGGVAFKLAQALLHESKKPETLAKWLIDLVAISSVADMVPLLGETRTLVKFGLIVMEKMRRLGIKKILQISGLLNAQGKIKNGKLSATDIAFKIAPRINAAGRMNHANVAFKLLMSTSIEEADKLVAELQMNNTDRQALTEELVHQAKEIVETTGQTENSVIFVLGQGWQTGILGLIASKIKDIYNRPAIVMGQVGEKITGSGRSVEGFNMISSLQKMPQFFKKFGGHPQACGFSLASADALEDFKKTLIEKARVELANKDLSPRITIDAEVQLEDITWELFDILDKFEPFGVGNMEPHYVARGATVHSVESVGTDGKHVRLHVKHGNGVVRKFIGFFCKTLCANVKPEDKIDIVFEVGANEWNGTRELQLKIVDIRKV